VPVLLFLLKGLFFFSDIIFQQNKDIVPAKKYIFQQIIVLESCS